jgi:hypothetical protein
MAHASLRHSFPGDLTGPGWPVLLFPKHQESREFDPGRQPSWAIKGSAAVPGGPCGAPMRFDGWLDEPADWTKMVVMFTASPQTPLLLMP